MLKHFSLVFFLVFGCYVGVNSLRQPLKHLTTELEVHAPASEVWEAYRNLGILRIAAQRNFVRSFHVLKGDGGVGTVVRIFFVGGRKSGFKERIIVADDVRRVEVAQALEGDCLAIGCSVEIVRFEMAKKSHNSSIIKAGFAYAVKKGFEAKHPKPSIHVLETLSQLLKDCVENKYHA
ncbi:hypothetical protein V6N13_094691 [Hibiscus sabdariffa]|uniref:Bet v I/Major latex protein domain-containing protein n=1 Tax=Hibiscus sabdariffa TaxID=183260 RepID=A0ABR2B914_9ROSI